MSLSSQELLNQIKQNCADQAEIVADCLNRCLDVKESITAGEVTGFQKEGLDNCWQAGGMLVVLETGDGGVVAFIPEDMPLPGWVHHPDESQASRLGTLGMEWSMSMMPEEFQGTGFSYHLVKNCLESLERAELAADAFLLPLELSSGKKIYVVGPVAQVSKIEDPAPAKTEEPVTKAAETKSEGMSPEQLEIYQRVQRIRRLIPLKVPVIVHLADKKIQMKHLTSLSPGMLITFNKSCDDLLDLYVNNQLFCRGEAVKIGENFGIKINEVGSQIAEESGILMI